MTLILNVNAHQMRFAVFVFVLLVAILMSTISWKLVSDLVDLKSKKR